MWPAPRPMAARAFVLRPPRWAPAALGVAAVLHRRQPVRCASLYPETEAKTGKLKTKDGTYELYYEVSGNPEGRSALFLHGGPGDGCSPKHRRLFDPEAYRIVSFDQRGAGQSKSLRGDWRDTNTTEKLVEDIEQLRRHLGVQHWNLVVGGSWGSTLALAYARRHLERVKAMVLYSIFIPSKESIDFPYSATGAGLFYPEAYEDFVGHLEVSERSEVIRGYARRLCSADPEVYLPARSAYLRWVMRLLSLEPDEGIIEEVASKPEDAGPGLAIEMHYMSSCCFLNAEQLLLDCRQLHVPCRILHGRNDLICPPANAWKLLQVLPQATLRLIPMAGHSSSLAPQLKEAIVDAIDAER